MVFFETVELSWQIEQTAGRFGLEICCRHSWKGTRFPLFKCASLGLQKMFRFSKFSECIALTGWFTHSLRVPLILNLPFVYLFLYEPITYASLLHWLYLKDFGQSEVGLVILFCARVNFTYWNGCFKKWCSF